MQAVFKINVINIKEYSLFGKTWNSVSLYASMVSYFTRFNSYDLVSDTLRRPN